MGIPRQFIVLHLNGVETGHPDLESADVLANREVQVEEIAGRIMGCRVFEVIIPIELGADLGSLREHRHRRIGDGDSRREVPDVVADAQSSVLSRPKRRRFLQA